MTYRDPIAEAMRERDAAHFERNGATMAAHVTRCNEYERSVSRLQRVGQHCAMRAPDLEALRADVRRTELALQACALDVGAAGLWDGDTASAEREEMEARAEHEAACAALDRELWWRAVMADPRIAACEAGEARASLRAAGGWECLDCGAVWADDPDELDGACPGTNPGASMRRELRKKLERAGCKLTKTGGGHWRVRCLNGKLIYMADTPSDRRAWLNTRAELRRAGVEV